MSEPAPNEPPPGAMLLVQFAAGCLIVVGLLEVGLQLARHLLPQHRTPVEIFPLVLDSIPVAVGLVMLIKAKAIANWIAEKLDL